jgi:AcrR family transcriptional regulator
MELEAGRRNQKLRTRKALVDAANAFLDRGERPTLDEVAEAALVSRATAYRYFPSVDALLADAFFERVFPPPSEVLAGASDDAVERVLRAEAAVNDPIFANQLAVYVVTKLYAEHWLEQEARERPLRPSRRLAYIDAALEPLAGRLTGRQLRRLRHGLALAIGTEAPIALTNVCGLTDREAREVTRWVVEALVRQGLAE